MQTVFIVCFGVGVGYALIGFILGEVLGVIHLDSAIHVDGGDAIVSPLKPVLLAVFLIVFGGLGLLLLPKLFFGLTLVAAALCGLAASFLFYRFILVPMYKAQNTSTPEIQSLVGHAAKVTELIPQGKYGKITYYVNGNTYSAPAKSDSGDEIKRDTPVEIMYIENHTYYVREKI